MKVMLLAGAVIGAMTAGPVLAAELPVERPSTFIPTPIYTWNGLYVGIHGGWGAGDAIYHFRTRGFFNGATAADFSHTMNGGLAGGHIGYNWQMSPDWLWGIEAAGTWSGLHKREEGPLFINSSVTTDVRWLATLTPRIGMTVGNWLWYVKGGAAFGDIFSRVAVGPFSVEKSGVGIGWTVGLGGEVLLGNWVLGGDANFYDLGSISVRESIDGLPRSTDHFVHVTMWSLLLRVSYKFGGAAKYGGPVPYDRPIVGRY